MIPQRGLLYAVDARNTAVFIVVGWRESSTSAELLPVLAPLTAPGSVMTAGVTQTPHLIYSPQPRALFPLRPAPSADTAVLPAVRPSNGRLRP